MRTKIYLTSDRLTKAGWLSVANAVLTVPFFLFSLTLVLNDSYGARATQASLTVISAVIFIYVMLTLLDYLNSVYSFHDTDRLVKLLLWMTVAVSAVSMLGLLSQPLQEAGGLISLLLIIPSGVLQALFGYRLLRLAESFGGRLKVFCVLNIVTGISFALVIPIPLGLFSSAAADIVLGKILLQGAEKMRHK